MTRNIHFGAAYYPEYTPRRPVDLDLDLMHGAGLNLVRVGESVWSTWEPADGEFDLDWLQPTLDGCLDRGIDVVLGTPTYAVPMWLARKYPDIAAEDATGRTALWGRRQEVDFTNPTYLEYAERIIRAVIGRYAGHRAVVGYQLDNEPGLRLLHNPSVVGRFVDELRETYGDVDALNDQWGLTHWSHRLSTWDDLWDPHGNVHPQYDLAWRSFQTRLTTEFIEWQATIVRDVAASAGRDDQFVTTCVAYDVPAVDEVEVNRSLDVAAGNPYYPMQDDLALPAPDTMPDRAWMMSGAWVLTQLGDRMWASKQAPFLATETNAGSIGDSTVNYPAWDGQWRQAAWALVARGAKLVEYWHWNSLHTGTEMTYAGILPHDQKPGRVYEEIARIGAELSQFETLADGLVPDGDVGMLYSVPSKWAVAFQPPWLPEGASYDFFTRYERAYDRLVGTWARGVFDAGLSSRIVHDRQLVRDHVIESSPASFARSTPVLIAPALYAAPDRMLRWLEQYAAEGGHLVLGIRTGYADGLARARQDDKPGLLSAAAGVSYQESSNLDAPVPLLASEPRSVGSLALPAQSSARNWVDFLIPTATDTEVLATYAHPQFGKYAAVTTRRCGSGRITVVGTEPDPRTAADLVHWALGASHASTPKAKASIEERLWSGGASVRVSSSTNRSGDRLHVVHNWSWTSVSVRPPSAVSDVLSAATFHAGDRIELAPWDVRVLREA